jgi:hypothetical protein
MPKTDHPRRYNVAAYDQHLCLKPPWLLWICAFYLSRAFSLPVILGMSSLAGGSANTTGLMSGLFNPSTLVPSCIAFLVLFSLVARSPSGGRGVRWIFARGRLLLVLAAVIDLGLAVGSMSLQQVEAGDERVAGLLLSAFFDVYFLIYLLFSKRVRDVFADFPAATAS